MGRLKEYFIENPFLLAHHPSCDKFSDHTLDIRGWKLCMGCFVIYPTAAVTLTVLFFLSGRIAMDYIAAFAVALAMFTLNAVRKLVFRDRLPKNMQVAFRMILGISLAFMLFSIWLAPGPERYSLMGLFLAVAIGYNLLNSRKMNNTCKSCPRYTDFPKCEGLRGIK